MASSFRQIVLLVSIVLTKLLPTVDATRAISFDHSSYPPESIIKRDIAIVGGGSSGTYTAIALNDRNKTVAVIEQDDYLGGHTNTYTDPASGKTVDYGVLEFDNTDTVKNYFARFDIPLLAVNSSYFITGLTQYYVDFRTGKQGHTPKDPSAAFAKYGEGLAKYPYLAPPGINLPNPVPADLSIPFGEFVQKYNIGDAVFTINDYEQGPGPLLDIPSLYVIKNFGLEVLEGALSKGFLITARENNSELYEKAGKVLGDNVFLRSTVLATSRSNSGVKLVIRTPQGLKLVIASKLLISIPPLLSNLRGFDLSIQERTSFQQWVAGAYYTSLVADSGLPENVNILDVGPDAAYNLPQVPAAYSISPTIIPGLVDIKFGSPHPFPSNDAVKFAILDTIHRVKSSANILNITASNPKIVAFKNHTPYALRASSEAIQGGFYAKLNSLQGARGEGGKSTWYTGAAWNQHNSADLWAFTEGVVEDVLGG